MTSLPIRRRVLFMHRTAQGGLGSKLMRCDQLCAMARRHLGAEYDFAVERIPPSDRVRLRREAMARTKGAILIFLKQSVETLDDDEVETLRQTARGICIDHVDAAMTGRAMRVADLHIAASHSGYRALQGMIAAGGTGLSGAVRLLAHHADPRLHPLPRYADARLRVGYFGARANTTIPAMLRDMVDAPAVEAGRSFPDILGAMRRSNLHYAVRPRPSDEVQKVFKPFTKGFNAAMANANIIVNADADDAAEVLGGDYPFLIRSSAEPDIIDGIRHAQDAFGSAEWRAGLDVMADVRRHCAPDRIMAQLRSILGHFG